MCFEMLYRIATLKPINYAFSKGQKDIRSEPDFSANIITTIDLSSSAAVLLEIGKPERVKGDFDAWLKVEVNGIVGWVYGGLILK